MKDSIIGGFIAGIFILLLIVVLILFINNEQEYIYECTDYKGNVIYCTTAYTERGGMFGYTEDGTFITITSYKRILKGEE